MDLHRNLLRFQTVESFRKHIFEGHLDICRISLSPTVSVWFFPEGLSPTHALEYLSLEHFNIVFKCLNQYDIAGSVDTLTAQLGFALQPKLMDKTVFLPLGEHE